MILCRECDRYYRKDHLCSHLLEWLHSNENQPRSSKKRGTWGAGPK